MAWKSVIIFNTFHEKNGKIGMKFLPRSRVKFMT